MMLRIAQQPSVKITPPSVVPASRALEWLWRRLEDIRNPHILDCGPVSQATLNVLFRRGAKLYVADLVTPARRGDAEFWDRSKKQPLFLLEKFLDQIPSLPPGSLAAIFCWHLFDLLPRDALAGVMGRLCSYLRPGGALFCLLREPLLSAGSETDWWLETLVALASSGAGRKPFPYPAVTNRDVERIAVACATKTFLTKSGRREVLALKH